MVEDLDDFAFNLIDPFNDLIPLYDEITDDLRQLNFFLDLLSWWLLRSLSDDDSKPDDGDEGGVRT